MKNIHIFAYNYLLNRIERKKISKVGLDTYLSGRTILGKKVMNAQETNRCIKENILSGKPFMAGRLGGTEIFAMRTAEFDMKSKYLKAAEQISTWSGFFPKEESMLKRFNDVMTESIPQADIMGVFISSFERYYLGRYGKSDIKLTNLFDLEPWRCEGEHWSSALKGKKVLIIHPFEQTIQEQYKVREKLFPGTDILPEFELKTLKAVQTVAGQKDERFETWFDALEWMYDEAMKIDFDIAIIGCGAYGFPLAAKLKKAGKQAIHLGGATQLMFGIKGKRWLEETKDNKYAYIQKYFNDFWVFPSDADRPKQAEKVEGGCYW